MHEPAKKENILGKTKPSHPLCAVFRCTGRERVHNLTHDSVTDSVVICCTLYNTFI